MIKLDKKTRGILWGLIAVIFTISLYLVVVLGIWFGYSGKIKPGVTVAGISFGAQNDEEILATLEQRGSEYIIVTEGLGEYEVVFDYQGTLAEAKGALENPFLIGKRINVPLQFSFNSKNMYQKLSELEKRERVAVLNPVINEIEGELKVVPGKNGVRALYGENVAQFKTMIGNLEEGFALKTAEVAPVYTEGDLQKSLETAAEISARGLTLSYQNKNYEVPTATIASWVRLGSQTPPLAARLQMDYLEVLVKNIDRPAGYYDTSAIESYLGEIAKKTDRDPVNATLTFKDGKVDIFALSQTGLVLNISENTTKIMETLDNGETKLTLLVEEIEPEITQNSLADLGIVELVAEGRSNFAGSPANRRHNIRVGAARFNGLLIKPGETFSFTKNLGAVDAGTGYLPELVIKDNETVPEYGGGLCQVSSTTFRAALNAGLPIVARRAHAYPVTYYKPYGTDATIYIPNPDLKFTNDTGHHILIQTRIVGNYLYFDFYGTKKTTTVKFAGNKEGTGAVARIEDVKPYIYDNGVRGEGSFTAVFWYFVYDANGKLVKTDDFISKYDSPLKYPH